MMSTMPPRADAQHLPAAGGGAFHTTHWSVVLAARQISGTQAATALESLCRTYWYPIYAFIRRQGCAPSDAEDLTQAFFARLLEKNYLNSVDPAKGRFRSFLLAAVKHFLADERDRAAARKRGGGVTVIALDTQDAEARYRLEPADDSTPDKLFDRRWALSLLSTVFDRLARHYRAAGKEELFAVVQEFLSPSCEPMDYSSAARQLGMKEGAVRMAVHRLRRRYGELFREEVAHTVAEPGQIEDEMRELLRGLSG